MFPLHPETPPEGTLLEDLFNVSRTDISKMIANLKMRAESLGLPFGERHMTYNSRLAQELGKWAESLGKGREFHHHAFRAYFEHGKNIAESSILLDLAKQCKLPTDEAREVLSNRTFSQAVDLDWQRCRDNRIQAVPSFIYGNRTLVGAQNYATLAGLLNGTEPSPFPPGF